jgi:hypothetical protein
MKKKSSFKKIKIFVRGGVDFPQKTNEKQVH